jgi:fructan beta-fructosidase
MRIHRLALTAVAIATLAATSPVAADTTPPSYHEPYRPQLSFSPAQNWMNDPNGPILYRGKYHLFFQYNPSGTTWGNISWGHAVSTDLVHWTQLPLAIPQDASEYIFSGSVVFDRTNSSGLGTTDNPPLVAIYTSTQKATGTQEQALAYSTDGGLTWTKYAGNPVLDINSVNFRDPKVFWYAPGRRWEMVLALSDQRKVSIYTSPDLKHWSHQSDFGPAGAIGGVWECPNLFPLDVDGNPADQKWVLMVGLNPGAIAGGSGDQYFVGSFDGTTFTSDNPATYTPPTGTTYQGFDNGTYAPWTTTGTAFGSAPATGPLPGQLPISGAIGTGFVDSFNGGDAATGTLTSPPFTVTSRYLNFEVGGGNHPHVPGTQLDPALPSGTVFADFEGQTWGTGWTATGDLANDGPAAGTLPGQQAVSDYLGNGLVNTFENGDLSTGTITSPEFTISSDYIDFLVGGGFHPYTGDSYAPGDGPTAIDLIVGGKVVDSATGANDETLNWASWHVAALKGQQAQIQIVDQNTGGWGHINVDHIMFSDGPAIPRSTETAVNLLVDGTVVDSATGSNAETLDWHSFDLAKYLGQQAQIQIVDTSTAGWGHVLADQFTFADAPALSSVQRAHWMDYGADFYAATTFNDLPDDKQIVIGWMNNWNYAGNIPTSPWRSADTVARQLALRTIDGKVELTQQPVPTLSALRTGDTWTAHQEPIAGNVPAGIDGATLDLDLTFAVHSAQQVGVDVHTGNGQYTRIGYDTATYQLFIDRTHSGDVTFDPTFSGTQSAHLPLPDGHLGLRILVDTSSVEVFAAQGQVVLTDQVFPDPSSTGVTLFATGGVADLVTGTGWHLRSIWASQSH